MTSDPFAPRPTRYGALGYRKEGKFWRFVDMETGGAVGEHYPTKIELLADLDRYYREAWNAGRDKP